MRALLRITFSLLTLTALVCAQGRSSLDDLERRPAPAQKNPFDTPQDLETGGRLFQTHCSYCHGSRGEGGRGADLTNGQYRYGGSDAELFSTIRDGIPGSEMPP